MVENHIFLLKFLPLQKNLVSLQHDQFDFRQWQELFYDNRESGVDLEGNPDFVMLAKSYGAAGISINNAKELKAKLKKAFEINDRPVIINAEVIKAQNVFPMIPPGAPLKNMIITPPKTQLNKPVGST